MVIAGVEDQHQPSPGRTRGAQVIGREQANDADYARRPLRAGSAVVGGKPTSFSAPFSASSSVVKAAIRRLARIRRLAEGYYHAPF